MVPQSGIYTGPGQLYRLHSPVNIKIHDNLGLMAIYSIWPLTVGEVYVFPISHQYEEIILIREKR